MVYVNAVCSNAQPQLSEQANIAMTIVNYDAERIRASRPVLTVSPNPKRM